MKKLTLIGLLILGLLFQNCKNDKSQKDDLKKNDTENVIQEEPESTKDLDNQEVEKENSTTETTEEVKDVNSEEATKPVSDIIEETEKEVVKTVEETTQTIKKEAEEVKEVVEEKVVEKVDEIKEEVESTTEPIIEKVIEKEAEIKKVTETVVEEVKTVVQTSNWVVPSKYKTMKNPTEASKGNIAIGKNLYSKHCKSCHGKEGLGDGTKADEVEGDLGDFSSKEFQSQTDGAVFYKSYIGRDDMPNYEKKIPDEEDVWLLVHYVRTLGN